MNLTARKLGGLFKIKYAVVRQRIGALRKRAKKHATLGEKRKATLLANKKDVGLGVLADQATHPSRAIDLNKPARVSAVF